MKFTYLERQAAKTFNITPQMLRTLLRLHAGHQSRLGGTAASGLVRRGLLIDKDAPDWLYRLTDAGRAIAEDIRRSGI